MNRTGPRSAVFLDRDGTLLDELGYRASPAGLTLLEGAADAVRRLNEAELPAVLITNQSGVARGLFDEADLLRVHVAFEAELARYGARLDGIFYCPHLPPDTDEPVPPRPHRRACTCRKPAPGLFLEAAERLGLDLATSFAVGDSLRDLEAAARAGIPHRFLVATGKGGRAHLRAGEEGSVDFAFVPDVQAAVERILASR